MITSKWKLPSQKDGLAFMLRSDKAEKDLMDALSLLEKVKDSIPQQPAQETKQIINTFLKKFL